MRLLDVKDLVWVLSVIVKSPRTFVLSSIYHAAAAGLSLDQARAQMGMWAMLAAPLIMSADLRTIRPEFRQILVNRNLIKINQVKSTGAVWGHKLYQISSTLRDN